MGEELDKDQIAILQKAFDSFAQGKGYITPEMVGTILRVMGQAFNEQTLRELIAEVDEDGSGQIEFTEFVILASKFIVEEDEETLQKELKEAFRLYDKAGNGYIPTSSLKEILRELDDKLTNEELDGIVGEIDEDGSGTVDFNEFIEMMTGK
ncbi:troponin C isoform X1 [Folsomia candida]|uniref:troponin C isoform X1 n=2 Tax=Folsomia candida TaxID=158441 RepID=UPI000B8EE922|nr:troponin C isoform X1 [Folsomia candida]